MQWGEDAGGELDCYCVVGIQRGNNLSTHKLSVLAT